MTALVTGAAKRLGRAMALAAGGTRARRGGALCRQRRSGGGDGGRDPRHGRQAQAVQADLTDRG
jgi:NAD(P)-dependent dehydrogenase (short-subunit alcohol dehydrogenase family)